MHLQRSLVSQALFCLALMIGLAASANAQHTYGTIVGSISDPSQAVIPGASVTATNTDTGIARSVETNVNGDYTILNLLPGTYEVSVEMAGFKRTVASGVVVRVNESVRVDLVMEVGQVVETVEVTSTAAPLLETTRSTIGTVVANEKVVELPLNGRDYTQLTLLLPGASPGATSGGGFIIGGKTVAVTGNRSDQNNYTLDGVNNNETFFQHYGIRPSLDAIQEFKVQTNITSAEFGAAAGANVNVAIKSGTNEIHGSVFEFFRNDNLDARTFFSARKPEFRWNQFGAAAGGPVVKNRTFWFANWESFRYRRESTILSAIPTNDMRNGIFQANVDGSPIGQIFDPYSTRESASKPGQYIRDPFPNNTIPSSLFHRTALTWQEGVYGPFQPNRPGLPLNFINTTPNKRDDDQFTLRGDHQVSDSNNLFIRWSWADADNISPTALPGRESTLFNGFRNLVMSDTHVFGPTTIFEFKFGYNSDNLRISTDPMNLGTLVQGLPDKFRDEYDYPLNLAITDFASAAPTAVVSGPQRTYQFLPSLTKITGNHTLKFGADLRIRTVLHDNLPVSLTHDRQTTSDLNDTTGTTGFSYAGFLLGAPSQFTRSQPLEAPGCTSCSEANMINNMAHFYAQDDYKVTRNLTINLGLRYEWTARFRSRNDPPNSSWFDSIAGKFVWAGPNPITGEPANTTPTYIYPDKNNWAPRFGFAYLLGNKTTIRGGYGIFFGSNSVWGDQHMRNNYPYSLSQAGTINTVFFDVKVDNPFPPLDPTRPSAQHTARRDNVFPYVQQWNFGIQKQLAEDLMWEINYVGSKGTRLASFIDGNNAPPGPPAKSAEELQERRPFPQHYGAFSENRTDAVSSYHGLTTKLEKRFSQGLSYRLNYSWSKSIDLNSQWGGTSPQNPLDARASIGLSDFHRAHIFSGDVVWQLPRLNSLSGVADHIINGWQVNSIVQLQSGRYLTATLPFDHNNMGGRGTPQRPDVTGSLTYNERPESWVSASSFTLPNAPAFLGDTSGFGTAGRNIIRGPGFANVDFSLYKNLPFSERFTGQLRFEFFNVFNHTNFNNPSLSWNPSNLTSFGVISSTQDARQIQIAAKLYF